MPPLTDAFPEMFQRHRAQVLALCRRLLGSTDRAEDAAQDVFVRAWKGHGAYDGSRPYSSWVLGIAAHHCIDVLRRRATETQLFRDRGRRAGQPDGRRPEPAAGADGRRAARGVA